MRSVKFVFLLLSFFAFEGSAQAESPNINRDAFYAACAKPFPKSLFKGESRITFDQIFDYWESTQYTDKRWLAYILATAYRETAGTMHPVREGKGGKCDSDKCSIDAVTALVEETNKNIRAENEKLKEAGKKPKSEMENYALPVNGKSYYGRGFVQITHKRNYARVGEKLGWGNELVENPDLALSREKAIPILIEGAVQGMFSKDKKTGEWRKLSTYLNEQKTDWVGARGIISPGSKRAHIPAEHAQHFYACLTSS